MVLNYYFWTLAILISLVFAKVAEKRRKKANPSNNLYLIAEILAYLVSFFILIFFMVIPSYNYYQG